MKLLVVASSLDLRVPLSSTPSWWQLLKALAERGTELIVAPYQGPSIESPWWTAAENPCQLEGDLVGWTKRFSSPRGATSRTQSESHGDRLVRTLVGAWTLPRWRRHLFELVQRHRDVDALLFLTVPPNHFTGIPAELARRFGLPTYLYDGDVPASLPRFAGFQTGFKIYQGADLGEYAGVFSNSRGGAADLEQLGAKEVRVLHYAADAALFSRVPVEEDLDVFFYGHGREYREEWVENMLAEPSRVLGEVVFATRGTGLGQLGRVRQLPYLSFSRLREYCCRSKINLLITRHAHASVYASSTARPFELAALGCAMVSNPYLGVEEWFEPGREVLVVRDAREAVDTYQRLLRDPGERKALGARARERFLAQHTYRHRAEELLKALQARVGTPAA